MYKEEREEAMELVGILEEKGTVTIQDLQAGYLNHPLKPEQIEILKQEELIVVKPDGKIQSTPKGKQLSSRIIRRHRLAERLIADILVLKDVQQIEESACDLEHALSRELTESICTLLGHPRVCPHGKPIPKGACCSERRTRIRSLISSLADFAPGEEGRIAYISTRDHNRLDQLSSMGLFPGTLVKVHQKQPALVILFEETTLALDREIAREIHLWRE